MEADIYWQEPRVILPHQTYGRLSQPIAGTLSYTDMKQLDNLRRVLNSQGLAISFTCMHCGEQVAWCWNMEQLFECPVCGTKWSKGNDWQ